MNSASRLRTFNHTMTGSPVQLALPAGLQPSQVGELWLQSTIAWSFSDSATGAFFSVAANTPISMPYNGATLWINGAAGTLVVAAFGWEI